MTEAILDEWTLKSRRECLVASITNIIQKTSSEKLKNWLAEWRMELTDPDRISMDRYNIYNRAFWGPIKKKKYANSELLKLCREADRQKMSRLIVSAYVYQAELQTLAGNQGATMESIMDHLDVPFEILKVNPDLHAAMNGADAVGCWAILETKFAQSTLENLGPGRIQRVTAQ
ncbi:hypothetical protein L914_00005 [Phytophthora nicotianae]|uniref:Uncharacterized protein n=1 Tax=Phytophthora nicotianae TaxID=4792 RepID=W2P800_PHYNI|nr:hypothetical protein L914_00005 [Phytophthora nicotianae]